MPYKVSFPSRVWNPSPLALSKTMSNSGEGVHILVFPYPAQGHMLPMLDLTHQLALRGLTITVLVTPKNLPILNPLLSSHPSIQTLVFPFPHHPSLPAGVENVSDVGSSGNKAITNALGKLRDPIIQWFKSHPTPPVAILSDFFLGWTQHLAHNLCIPRIVFFSSGAFTASVLRYLWDNFDTIRSLTVVDLPDLPRSPRFSEEHIPSVFRHYRESDPDWVFVRDCLTANYSSWGCVFNSFEALEGEYLDYLKKKMGHERVFGVGPLSLAGGFEPMDQVNPNLDSDDRVLARLDECPDRSVLYVCFGSQKLLKRTHMEALASGLEWSGVRFIGVVKSVTAQQVADGFGFIPDGFEDRVSGRGMVIRGWAQQRSILSHRAVGGFLSHCGWNSVLEGIVAGVMILAWPMEGDQFVNARLLVEDMGVAVRVWEGADAVPDSADLARIVAESMSGDVSEKEKAKKMREEALEAVKAGGRSSTDLDGLMRELTQLVLSVLDFPDLPRSPSFVADHVPSMFRYYCESDPDLEIVRDGMIANSSSWGCVFNTVDALEGEYLDYLRKKMRHGRVFAVGSLSPKLLKRAQMEALASGLERSSARFVWVVKSVTTQQVADGNGAVPNGFEEQVAGRGMVIKDQFVNARLLVEHMGSAVRVCEGLEAVPDSTELARIIAESMSGDIIEKARAKELRDKALEAVKEGGSSWKDLDGLVRQLSQLGK
ncbi:hypothetical protein F0562_033909 [Nyssa sinensis]|uniref:UDP-glycosyltransferases domain-containing protein n=1 Tax=Nyssa sinensis TaxID=561372 RepID=A0A5J5AHE6_9ASTE|nr:hypothetical protein F0562_033909 [Nyssa sinensis]